ncbi:helix-turn-helix domain-containing protein [Streptomyces luteireticuli]|uniref:Helix-turn-helix transcriptional regulator n=1 Tax=Streptomyces luteireticuli TaxID=173858 RepID=A0ABN0Y972_9ACTN
MDKGALQGLLRERRALIAPEEYGLTRPSRQGRRAPGLTQAQMDQLLHRAYGTYNRLETGSYPNPPEELLRDVARILAFNEHDWTLLWLYTLHRDPPTCLHPRSGTEVRGAWQDVVEGMSHVAYITDQSWRLVTYNRAFADIFPGRRVPSNTMRWMLLEPEAREILMGWSEYWLPMVLPQLRAGIAALPGDETLLAIEKDVLADPEAGPLYESGGHSYIHPDGDERPLNHTLLGPGWVSLCTAEPLSSPRARLMIMVFRPGKERRHAGPSILRAT